MIFLIENAFNEFLKDNAIWIALFFFLVIVLALLLIFLSNKKKSGKVDAIVINTPAIIDALGGKGNIVQVNAKGSRLSLTLKEKSLLNKEGLKQSGVTTIIEMSDKFVLVVPSSAEELAAKISLI